MNFIKIGKFLYKLLILPKSGNIDEARREFILNILLVGTIILATAGLVENLVYYFLDYLDLYHYMGIDPLIGFLFVVTFCAFLFLSRNGKAKLVSIILISFLFLSAFYTSFVWGADVPQALLIYALIIVMSGILVSTRLAFLSTVIIALILTAISVAQINSIYRPSVSWKSKMFSLGDTWVAVTTLIFLGLISWLFNREIERALKRAWKSEKALRKERDMLEIKVEKRTEQLKLAQLEKIGQLYRFAEFGRSASGIFHDLVNPLNLVSLNLNRLNRGIKYPELSKAETALQKAIIGTKQLEGFINAARRQMKSEGILQRFSIQDEIRLAIQMLEYRAKTTHVRINLISNQKIHMLGNPFKFNQLISNLVSNAIDAYEKSKRTQKIIEIRVSRVKEMIKVEVQDWGSGITEENLSKIFDPLFTTKSFEKGTGIGLTISKDIAEKDFKGKIAVKSGETGSTFTVEFPIKLRNS